VKLFVPSELAFRGDNRGPQVAAREAKLEVEEAAKVAGVPLAVVLVGAFTESSLAFPYV
jgi:hypothetical protein